MLGLGHDDRRPQDRAQVDAVHATVVERREQVADVQDPDDVVEVLLEHRIAGERMVEHDPQNLRDRQLGRHRDDVGPRDHHVGGVLVGELEDLVQHRLLVGLEHALLAARRHEHLELLLRVDERETRRRADADPPQHRAAGLDQHPDERTEEGVEPVDRPGDDERDALGVLERERLRDDLAHHDVEEAQDDERRDDRDGRRHARVPASREEVERRAEDVRHHGLADGAERQARERDAQLDRRDEARRVVDQAQHAGRGTAALGLQLLEAGAANRDKRVLGGDEESVRRDNQRHRHELEGGCHHVLGTSSLKRA